MKRSNNKSEMKKQNKLHTHVLQDTRLFEQPIDSAQEKMKSDIVALRIQYGNVALKVKRVISEYYSQKSNR